MDTSIANTLNDSTDGNDDPLADRINTKKQQFTTKQRLDMYAFCVIQLELHGDSVSIKKRKQAMRRAMEAEKKKTAAAQSQATAASQKPNQLAITDVDRNQNNPTDSVQSSGDNYNHYTDVSQQQNQLHILSTASDYQVHQASSATTTTTTSAAAAAVAAAEDTTTKLLLCTEKFGQQVMPNQGNEISLQQQSQHRQDGNHSASTTNGNQSSSRDDKESLVHLQLELKRVCRSYTDYQKTFVLTAAMLKDVQLRFAKYYPDSPVPSKTTIKHVFEKCLEHGTVENIKNPRKLTKIARRDEVEQLFEQEPQLSLRQMARKLNVSVGTVSRRCKALGLIPDSVSVKHQQLATAKRQKQIKKQHAKH